MRVATKSIYELGVINMGNRQADLFKLQNQLSTGRKVLTPSDDPVAAARSLDLGQATRLNEQYIENVKYSNSALSLSEANMGQITRVIQDIQQLAIQSGDPTLTGSEKRMVATDIAGKYQELLGLANTTDGNGQFLYSGFRGDTKPFNELSFGNVRYDGDQGQRKVQIAPSRDIPVSDSGADIFVKIKNGNGSFTTNPGQTDLPRSVRVGDGGAIQFNRDGPNTGFIPSDVRIDWDSTNSVYNITRIADGQVTQLDHNALVNGGGIPLFGMILTAVGKQPTTVNASANLSTAEGAANGTGVVSPGLVTDPVKWANANNPSLYRIAFHSVPDPTLPGKQLTSYDIINNDPAAVDANGVSLYNRSMIDGWDYANNTDPSGTGVTRTDTDGRPNAFPRKYVPGGDIVLAGLPGELTPLVSNWDFGAKLSISGVPADGDNFQIEPSRDYDLFSTIGDFSAALNGYADSSVSAAAFQNQLNTAVTNLANSLSKIVTVTAAVGARLKEADSVQNTNEDLNLQFSDTISKLTNLDYTKAISDFTQTQTYLDAARKSFSSIQSLSLFQYIS